MSKITLTLKQSSFLFIGSLNLIKDQPITVELDELNAKEVKILNRYIKSGGVKSDSGLLTIEEVEINKQVEEPVEEPVEELPVEVKEEVKEEVPVEVDTSETTLEKVKEKPTTPKRTSAKKK